MAVQYGNQVVPPNNGPATEQFSFTATVTAGTSPLNISKSIGTALATTNSNNSVSITSVNWSDNDTSGDSSQYFYVAPGQSKTFTANYVASASSVATTIYQVTGINVTLTSPSSSYSFNSSDVLNTLRATLSLSGSSAPTTPAPVVTATTLDLASVFPSISTPVCPTSGMVRNYTVTAFSYDVNIIAQTDVNADDNMTINGAHAGSTSNNTYCMDHGQASAPQITMNKIPAGTTIMKVSAGTPIVISDIDTVGVGTSASGILRFSPVGATSYIDQSLQTASVWDAIVNLFRGL